MLHRLTARIRETCPRIRRCAVSVLICVTVAASVYCGVERPHIGWGPALQFNPVRAPEGLSLRETRDWLGAVAQALIDQGYEQSVLQVVSPGQAFGLVKPIDEMWEYHVHGYIDGRVESEVELSRRYIQHLSNTYRADASAHLVELLDVAGIDCVPDGPAGEPVCLMAPANPIPWGGLVFLSPVFQALVSLDHAVRTS